MSARWAEMWEIWHPRGLSLLPANTQSGRDKVREHVAKLSFLFFFSFGIDSELEEVNELVLWRRSRRLIFRSARESEKESWAPEQEREGEIEMDERKEVWETKELSF